MAKIALLIGVSDYAPGLNPLPAAVKDVEAMWRVLVNPERGGFAQVDVTVLKNPQRQEMEEAIYRLFANRQKEDLLLFYFSGHGVKDESGRLYFSTVATRKEDGKLVKPSALAASVLQEYMNESKSQREVIVLDCNFSGAIAQGLTVKETVKDDGSVHLQEELGGKGRAILTSSSSTQYSFEQEGFELSIYTHYLVEGIENGAADKDGDGRISADELHEYASDKVTEAAPAMTPKFYPFEEGYKIFLAKSPKDDPKVKYRREIESRAKQNQGKFSVFARRLLDGKRVEWGISEAEAKLIEEEVLQPFREYERKLQEYEQTLMQAIEAEYPFSKSTEADLKDYQKYLGLRDEDIAAINTRLVELTTLKKLEPVYRKLRLDVPLDNILIGNELEANIHLDVVRDTTNIDDNTYLLEILRNEAVGNEINILLIAPSFQVGSDNTATLPIELSTNGITQTAHFCLTALRPGSATITAEIYLGDTFKKKLKARVKVAGFDETKFTKTPITTQPRPVPQPNFILRVQTAWNEANSACRFHYQIRSFRLPSLFSAETSYHSKSFSSSWIEQMRGLLGTTLEKISNALLEDGRSHLTSLGQYLFEHLLPPELQTDFRTLIPRDRTFTLLILADQDASLPWELLHDGQRFLSDRFIIGRWFWELNDTRPHEFPVGAINVAHYADVEQPELWTALLEPPGSPPPLLLPEGVLSNLDSTEAMRGLHLIRYSQSSDAANRHNAPVTLDDTNNAQDIERQMRPAKLNLRRNRPLVSLGYVRRTQPELTTLEQTWASAFIRAGCSAVIGSLWAVDPTVEAAFISGFYHRLWTGDSLGEAFHASRQLARAVAPDSLDWLAYVLFGDPMARPYRPVEGKGYAVVEPIGREIDDPLPPGVSVRFRLSLRRTPPVWHEERVIEVAENLTFENLQAHVKTFGLQPTFRTLNCHNRKIRR